MLLAIRESRRKWIVFRTSEIIDACTSVLQQLVSEVIASESLVPLIDESIESIPSKKNVRRKSIVPLFDP